MTRCLYPRTPRLASLASALVIPFSPLAVTCANIGVAEARPAHLLMPKSDFKTEGAGWRKVAGGTACWPPCTASALLLLAAGADSGKVCPALCGGCCFMPQLELRPSPNGLAVRGTSGLPSAYPVRCLHAKRAQVAFRNTAKASAAVTRARGMHMVAGIAGAACFSLEGLYPHFPCIHATWHCLSCLGVATTGDLVAAREGRFL